MPAERIAKRKTSEKTLEESKLLIKVGKRIASLTAKRGVSLEKVAYEGGVSKGYLYDLIRGKGNPSLLILSRISSSLEVEIKDLIS
ncbi:helix-turn-helix domain-containing protein [bacterium]|nr:helix-turn-helix domain-containing protein [bacterium]